MKGKKTLFTIMYDWFPLFFIYIIYELIRGHAELVQKILGISVQKTLLLRIETLIFGNNIPTLVFQKAAGNIILDYFAIIVYTSIIWGALFLGIIIYLKDKEFFLRIKNAYLLLVFLGLATYLIFPAYPPWMASDEGLLPKIITPWKHNGFGSSIYVATKLFGRNDVAPFPSLHAAYGLFFPIFFEKYYRKKIGNYTKLFYLYTLSMALVIIYTGDHYVVDIIAGFIYALAAIFISENFNIIKLNIKTRLISSN
ncbi:MAG: phosphatase PAP2 family protein [archaeon]